MTPPPIADPRAVEEKPSKPPFQGLRLFGLASALFFIASLVGSSCTPSSPLSPEEIGDVIPFVGVGVGLWGILLWRLWHKSNAARLIFWCVSAASLVVVGLSGFGSGSAPMWVRRLDYAEAAFAAFSLVWLQLPGVKAHFGRDKPL